VPRRPGPEPAATVLGVLHPVGKLPTAVYWRRRLLLLTLVLAVLGGAAWFVVALLDGGGTASGAASASASARPVPALERVVPSLSAIATPTPPLVTTSADAVTTAPAVPDPVAGGPCTDDMIGLDVRTPGSAAVGSKATFELLVSNVSAVPCVRALDKGLQELVLFDLAGNRVWGSNDCFPEASSDPRTLAPGEVVTIPLVWGGLASEPTCTAARSPLAPGSYLLRGRLDTKVSADAPLTIG
jgi:hypothetical protein